MAAEAVKVAVRCRPLSPGVPGDCITEGYNGTIFAYSQTGSEKSFTMQGVADPSSQKGIIPRAFEHIFESIQLRPVHSQVNCTLIPDDVVDLRFKHLKARKIKATSLNTLHYANQARNIRNKPCINEDPKDALLREYQEEIKKLKAILVEQMGARDSSGLLPAEAAHLGANPAPCLKPLVDLEAEKQLIREEYQEKLAQLQASYQVE
ncbi:hypothetical protein HGM15179_001846 [Zosterops borbonicus]|uniref:Kinesin motor domain-containing protein n=1 Tax=Zosterops borbonicus TaxID=364589 RepID=A0A8K1GWD5_9PASS|nr:hypothetical protein HGM15179_001846 [Zosterops borbonicus]